ncbi:MAG TPA: AmmeMemoRadiSam system protein B [Nannocystaceae bacterium]|nr:AmmeMemoRadiSam system protein B [Nannocystaceae bacterium]
MQAREPAVAGRFFPATRTAETVRELMADAAPAQRVHAIVAPHAGWMYSGAIAAQTWARAEVPRRVILMCPNHTGMGVRGSLWSGGAWKIPGGAIAIDDELRNAIAEHTELELDTGAHLREHAIEVHLPMLAVRNPSARIVPIVLARMSEPECRRLGEGLQRAIAASGDDVLVVASTDMSHYVPAEHARRLDALALARIEALDPAGLHATVEREQISMCGYVPTTVALHCAIANGARHAELVRYGNSGETSGDFDRVVGYAGLTVS